MLVSILTMSEMYPEIWDDFNVPAGADRTNILDTIKIECAELELLYSDPDILKYIIRAWSRKELPVWTKLQETLNYQYNPIWNVEGSETTERILTAKESRDLEKERTPDLTYKRTPNLTYKRTPDLTTTDKVAGYNSGTPDTKGITEVDGTDTNKETGTDTNTETGTDTYTDTGTVDNQETEKTIFSRGMNIGVMSTQALIKEQREIVQFTLAEFIKESFKNNFCLLVY